MLEPAYCKEKNLAWLDKLLGIKKQGHMPTIRQFNFLQLQRYSGQPDPLLSVRALVEG